MKVATDTDLASLAATSKRFCAVLDPKSSMIIWKTRFLAVYDYPIISSLVEFCWAYKIRVPVLRNFVHCDRNDARRSMQLEVLKEMVLGQCICSPLSGIHKFFDVTGRTDVGATEAYNPPPSSLSYPSTSLNIQAFADPAKSHWMVVFLSSPFYNDGYKQYGESNLLFDALQLTFSYLLLSPTAPMAHKIHNGRDKYDMVKVYNWNKDFRTLYASADATNLDASPGEPDIGEAVSAQKEYTLDLNTLLHIRNFWHRHLLDETRSLLSSTIFGERTYSIMAKALADLGHSPRAWKTPLPAWHNTMEDARVGNWYGHYSCLHRPWPKTRRDLEDRQSCAEDWDKIDAMVRNYLFRRTPLTVLDA